MCRGPALSVSRRDPRPRACNNHVLRTSGRRQQVPAGQPSKPFQLKSACSIGSGRQQRKRDCHSCHREYTNDCSKAADSAQLFPSGFWAYFGVSAAFLSEAFMASHSRVARAYKTCVALLFCTALAVPSDAQTFTNLFTFEGTDGEYPLAPLVQGQDGNLYGTSAGDGISDGGTVFKITTKGALTT